MPDREPARRLPEQATGAGVSPDKLPVWRRHGSVIRSWLVFVVSMAVMIQVLIWARPFTDTVLPRWIAKFTAWVMALAGAEGEARGTIVYSSVGAVEIIRECTAVYPTALFLAGVFAFRCSWRKKLLGVFGGIFGIQLINLVRIVSLIFLHKRYPASFHFLHMVVWQSLVVFLTVVLWLLWSTDFWRPVKRDAA
jgi:exosortase/archaeosortase family protein